MTSGETAKKEQHKRLDLAETKIILVLVILAAFLILVPLIEQADAHIGNDVKNRCRISVTPESKSILYDHFYGGAPQHNPNGTFYPGDKSSFRVAFTATGVACQMGGFKEIWDNGAIILTPPGSKSKDDVLEQQLKKDRKINAFGTKDYFKTEVKRCNTTLENWIEVPECRGYDDKYRQKYGPKVVLVVSGKFEVNIERANECHGKHGRSYGPIPAIAPVDAEKKDSRSIVDNLRQSGKEFGYGGEDEWQWGREHIPHKAKNIHLFESSFKEVTEDSETYIQSNGPIIQSATMTGTNSASFKFSEPVTAASEAFENLALFNGGTFINFAEIISISGSGTDVLNLDFVGNPNATHMKINIGLSEPISGSKFKMEPITGMNVFQRMNLIEAKFEKSNEDGAMNWINFKFEDSVNLEGNDISLMIGKYVLDNNGNTVWDGDDVSIGTYHFTPDSLESKIGFMGNFENDDVAIMSINGGGISPTKQPAMVFGNSFEITQPVKITQELEENEESCGEIGIVGRIGVRHTSPPHCEDCGNFTSWREIEQIIQPRIKAPVTETVFVENMVKDPYGYDSPNIDGSNYVWDPIPLEHAADFDFNEQRSGTITFEYERKWLTKEEYIDNNGGTRGLDWLFDNDDAGFTWVFDQFNMSIDNDGGKNLIEEDAGYLCDGHATGITSTSPKIMDAEILNGRQVRIMFDVPVDVNKDYPGRNFHSIKVIEMEESGPVYKGHYMSAYKVTGNGTDTITVTLVKQNVDAPIKDGYFVEMRIGDSPEGIIKNGDNEKKKMKAVTYTIIKHVDDEEAEYTCSGPLEIGNKLVVDEDTKDKPGDSLDEPKGPLDAIGIGFLPYTNPVENGGGMFAYTGTSPESIGDHVLVYKVTIYNTSRMINNHVNVEEQRIVEYNPLYEHYEYPVLMDNNRYAYDDRQGMVIYYGGSFGGGEPDNEYLNTERRSRINAYYPETLLHSEGEFTTGAPNLESGGLTVKPPIRVDPERLKWDSIDHINGTETEPWQTTGDAHGLGDAHAIFYNEGYGILRFLNDMSDIVFADHNWNAWYWNATTYNEVASDRWAGHDSYRNWNYTYQYPHTPFSQWFNMTAYDSYGLVYPAGDMYAEITVDSPTHSRDDFPEFTDGSNVVVMLDDYMWAKTLHDMDFDRVPTDGNRDNEIFATGVVDEMHSMENVGAGSDGKLSLWINKTGLEFNHGYVPDDSILGMDRYYALDNEALMNINMTSNGAKVADTFTFEFWDDMHVEFIQDESDELDAKRIHVPSGDSRIVSITVPEKFGTVKTIHVNGNAVATNVDCSKKCNISAPVGGLITVENEWGATSSAVIDEPEITKTPVPNDIGDKFEDNFNYLYFMAVIGMIGFMGYKVFKRLMRDVMGDDVRGHGGSGEN